nr:hypothetical protein [Halpernia humi]
MTDKTKKVASLFSLISFGRFKNGDSGFFDVKKSVKNIIKPIGIKKKIKFLFEKLSGFPDKLK